MYKMDRYTVTFEGERAFVSFMVKGWGTQFSHKLFRKFSRAKSFQLYIWYTKRSYSYTHFLLTGTDLVLYIPHERTQAGSGGGVRVPLHPALQELLLLWVLLQREVELTNILHLLWRGGGRHTEVVCVRV